MIILQILPTISFGDGVSNDCIAIKKLLINNGYNTDIYAENIDFRLEKGTAKPIAQIPELKKDDIVIYHLSTGSELNIKIAELTCKLIIRYHNITPPEFFTYYSEQLYNLCYTGRKQAEYLIQHCDYIIADSEYNKSDLYQMGYRGEVTVIPILVPFQDYTKLPDAKIMFQYNDSVTNIIFTGRIAPNKKQEDIIKTFYYYSKYFNSNTRLFLIGSYNGMEKYYNDLTNYAKKMGLNNVFFTGHIKYEQILAYYHLADVFLCMSEHEGFCIPLLEAMYFHVPIIARNTSAISETLGNSGILLDKKDCLSAAALINQLIISQELKNKIIVLQNERLKSFSDCNTEQKILRYLQIIIE